MPRSTAKVVALRQRQKMGKLPPRRRTNAELRSREYLTEPEIEKLMKAAEKVGRHGHRDATLILIAYRHALRVSELVSLRWDAIDLGKGYIHINRLKNGRDGTHPLSGREIRALRRLKREYPDTPHLFVSERGGPMTPSNVRKMLTRAGEGLRMPIHPHMLRHGCGFRLANKGIDTRSIQQYMGHSSISSTVVYTEIAPDRFKGFWKD
ncbi:MAG TPA: tyrosine-type recombinase/integrase [Verrucomicrobiae bacterium]|nr:tyrosine-type recombinase/integrase [Verrucomicrobiae bacterium]